MWTLIHQTMSAYTSLSQVYCGLTSTKQCQHIPVCHNFAVDSHPPNNVSIYQSVTTLLWTHCGLASTKQHLHLPVCHNFAVDLHPPNNVSIPVDSHPPNNVSIPVDSHPPNNVSIYQSVTTLLWTHIHQTTSAYTSLSRLCCGPWANTSMHSSPKADSQATCGPPARRGPRWRRRWSPRAWRGRCWRHSSPGPGTTGSCHAAHGNLTSSCCLQMQWTQLLVWIGEKVKWSKGGTGIWLRTKRMWFKLKQGLTLPPSPPKKKHPSKSAHDEKSVQSHKSKQSVYPCKWDQIKSLKSNAVRA